MSTVRRAPTRELGQGALRALRRLFDAAWPDPDDTFTDEDWEHTIGGVHFLIEEDGSPVAHASVIERELHVGDRPLRTGYVEAVAVRPDRQRRGLGTAVMREVAAHIDERFELGALGTGELAFYERLGWRAWSGPTFVRTPEGRVATPEEDGFIMVRFTPSTPPLDPTAPISCEWRPGDAW